MTRATVTEVPRWLEPVSRDTFIDDLCTARPDEAAPAGAPSVPSRSSSRVPVNAAR